MTSRLEEQAERDLARMQDARESKRRGKAKAADKAKPTEDPRARFIVTESEAMGRPGVYWIGTGQDRATGAAQGRSGHPRSLSAVLTAAADRRWCASWQGPSR